MVTSSDVHYILMLMVKLRMGGWRKQVEEESVKVGLIREDAPCRSKWSVGINQIAAGLR